MDQTLPGKIAEVLRTVLGVPKKKPYTSALIVAGGHSTRMGEGISKQMLSLCGKPVVVHTLLAFEACAEIDEIVVVAKEDEKELYREFAAKYGLSKLSRVVSGGETRQESVKNGFGAIAEKAEFVAIHDGARCLITPEEITLVLTAAYRYGAATAAFRATETVKTEKDGFISGTLDRNTVWLARTPQVFGCDLYRAALAVSEKDGLSVTDDCSLVEHIDYPIRLVPCSVNNIKITTPEDLSHARSVLESRKEEEA